MKYQINGLFKFAEEDNYNDGCDPDTATHFLVETKFTGKSPDDVINQVMAYLGVDADGVEKNACDEKGRVDFSLMEDSNGNPATKSQLARWKKGQQKLWAVTYTGTVEKVSTVTL